MSDYRPIVVAAPSAARERLRRSGVLPPHLFREISSEQMWAEHSAPSIYLWPYDIPYAESDELRKIIADRVGDVPAFFGMGAAERKKGAVTVDLEDAKDHQERMLAKILFGSIIVHVVFLDNRKTDTTPDVEERNETYAQFCTFGEIVQWSRNLKQVMDVRFLNTRSQTDQILVLVSCGQQVIASRKEIEELNELIGSSSSKEKKPFRSCYFLDLNLAPGSSGRIFHSKYIWDVLISRFLLALLLSQEDYKGAFKPLWKNSGVKVWRASDCVISIPRDRSQDALTDAMTKAFEKLQGLVDNDQNREGAGRQKLLREVTDHRNELFYKLEPRWQNGEMDLFKFWAPKRETKLSVSLLSDSFFGNWSDLPVSRYDGEIKDPGHWQAGVAALRQQREAWCMKYPPEDYTLAVGNLFQVVRQHPGELGHFISRLFKNMTSTHEHLKNDHAKYWDEIVAAENKRRQTIKQLTEDRKEFEKAQRYYIGRGLGLFAMASVTTFCGWIIWRILSLLGVEFPMILLLAGMVFAGSAVAYILVMVIHNFTGNRAAGKLLSECLQAEEDMWAVDERVREMFFEGVKKRDVLSLQCVRFRTWLLAKRALAILQTEMQPQLSKNNRTADPKQRMAGEAFDPDHVRDAYLKLTRKEIGPLAVERIGQQEEKELVEKFITGDKEESFLSLWQKLCSEDHAAAGYFPAQMFIARIRSFVLHLQDGVLQFVFDKGMKNGKEKLREGFKEFIRGVHFIKKEDGSLLSASLTQYSGEQTSVLFLNSSLEEFREASSKETVKELPSELLKMTRTAALFYQEYDVDFDWKEIPGADNPDFGQLTFKSKPRGVVMENEDGL